MSCVPRFAKIRFGAGSAAIITLASIACFAGLRIHLEVKTTLLGYEVARLKNEESRLLEARSALEMQLSKMTTQQHLMLISESGHEGNAKTQPSYAAK